MLVVINIDSLVRGQQSSIDSQLFAQNRNFSWPHLHSTLQLGSHNNWYGKTRMMWLPNGLLVITKFTNVTIGCACIASAAKMGKPYSCEPWSVGNVSHCRILSADKTEWRLISATLCGWRRCFVADQLWLMKRIWEEEEVGNHSSVANLYNREPAQNRRDLTEQSEHWMETGTHLRTMPREAASWRTCLLLRTGLSELKVDRVVLSSLHR